MTSLFTIGYAGHTPDSLVRTLSASNVRVLVDVRANPVSRKKGFSKRQLAESLGAVGIEYRSIRELGIPTADRNAVTGGAEGWSRLLSEYAKSLGDAAQRKPAAAELADACKEANTALMCMESDLGHCHRKPLSEWVAATTGLQLSHL